MVLKTHLNLRSFYIETCLLLFGIITPTDGEVSHFVRVLASSNNTKVISELLLLQVALGEVFQLSFAEFQFSRARDSKLCAISGDDNIVRSKSSCLSSDLDFIVKVLFEHSNVKDFIVHGLCAVDDELDGGFLSFDL